MSAETTFEAGGPTRRCPGRSCRSLRSFWPTGHGRSTSGNKLQANKPRLEVQPPAEMHSGLISGVIVTMTDRLPSVALSRSVQRCPIGSGLS
jgi:hypothetical protein